MKNNYTATIFILLAAVGLLYRCSDCSGFEYSKVYQNAKADFKHLPDDIWDGSKKSFLDAENLTFLLIAGGASIEMHNSNVDKDTAKYFERHEIFHSPADRTLNFVGGPAFHFGAAILWYSASAEKDDKLNQNRAWIMIKALSVTGLSTAALKVARDNETPSGDEYAWPSGHTSSSFTVAAVLDEFYGPKVGIPAYIGASMVGIRMMDQEDHWASDVVFGATLGWIVGHSIAGDGKLPQVAGFQVIPYTYSNSGPTIGLNFRKVF